VVPDQSQYFVKEFLEVLNREMYPSFLSVLKRLGPQGNGLMSFPFKGWTLAVDIPIRNDNLSATLREMDVKLLEAGGRIYLAKDSRMHASVLPEMYPSLQDFRKVLNRLDPNRTFQSDLSVRLKI
jgi:decaprenylphospho-beta-D-ribofuranose 2-oxidase